MAYLNAVPARCAGGTTQGQTPNRATVTGPARRPFTRTTKAARYRMNGQFSAAYLDMIEGELQRAYYAGVLKGRSEGGQRAKGH